jgi:hypothetical protein
MVDAELARNSLSEFFEQRAQWRRLKAEECSHDSRNLESAESLERLAKFVLTLNDDSVLLRFRKLSSCFENDVFDPPKPQIFDGNSSSNSDAEASRCGFGQPLDSPDAYAEWLTAWAVTVESEALAFRRARTSAAAEFNELSRD